MKSLALFLVHGTRRRSIAAARAGLWPDEPNGRPGDLETGRGGDFETRRIRRRGLRQRNTMVMFGGAVLAGRNIEAYLGMRGSYGGISAHLGTWEAVGASSARGESACCHETDLLHYLPGILAPETDLLHYLPGILAPVKARVILLHRLCGMASPQLCRASRQGRVQQEGHWLARSSQPCILSCSAHVPSHDDGASCCGLEVTVSFQLSKGSPGKRAENEEDESGHELNR